MKRLLGLMEIINDRLEQLTTVIIVLLMTAMILIVFGQVVGRFLFKWSPAWMEEMSRFLMIWLAYIGAALMVRKGGHIGVTMVRNALPIKARRTIFFVDRIILTVCFILLTFYGMRIALRYMVRTPITMDFPMFYVYLLFPITFSLMFLFCIEDILRLIVSPGKVGHLYRRVEDPELLLSGELEKLEDTPVEVQKGG